MARTRVQLNPQGISQVLKSREMGVAIKEAAEHVADNVKAMGIKVDGVPGDIDLPVKISTDTTDQATAWVTLAHPAGMAVQAKHGALTKAAAQAGLDVSARR